MEFVIKDKKSLSECFFALINGAFHSQKDKIRFEGTDFSLSIALRGEAFNATINASIAKSVIEFQKTVNRAYACYLNKNPGKKLSSQERKQCEIYVKVESGSTLLKFVLDKIFNPEIVNNMEESTKKLLIIVIGSVILGACILPDLFSFLERNEEAEANSIIVREAFETTRAAYRHIAQSDAEKIIINDDPVSIEQLKELTKNDTKPKPLVAFDLSGMFKVLSIEIDYQTETSFARLLHEESGEIFDNVNLQDCYLSEEKLRLIKEAEKKDPIPLEIHVSKEGDKIKSVHLKL